MDEEDERGQITFWELFIIGNIDCGVNCILEASVHSLERGPTELGYTETNSIQVPEVKRKDVR